MLHTIKRTPNWIGCILCRNCLLKQVTDGKIEGRIEVMGRWGRRHEQLLDEFKEKREYWESKDEALDCTHWRASFGKGYGPVIRQATGYCCMLNSGTLVLCVKQLVKLYCVTLHIVCMNTTTVYTGCPRRNGQNFGRVFLMLKYADITQNTYIQS